MLEGLSERLSAIVGSEASLLNMLQKAKTTKGEENTGRPRKKKKKSAEPPAEFEESPSEEGEDDKFFDDFDDEEDFELDELDVDELDVDELDMDALDEFDMPESGEVPSGGGGQVSREMVAEIVEDVIETKMETVEENTQAIKELQNNISKMDVTFSTVKRDNDEIKERLDKIDESVLELLSLYEIVSNQVNPFVGEEDKSASTIKKFDEIENTIHSLQQTTERLQEKVNQPQGPAIPDDFRESVEERFEVLEGSIQAMTQAFDEISTQNLDIDEERITMLKEAVVEEVMDEVKHEVEQEIEEGLKSQVESQTPSNDGQQDVETQAPQEPPAGATQPVSTQPGEASGARLSSLDSEPETVITLIHWIEFLMERVGRNNLLDVLEYYVEIGWISEGVRESMISYASGIDYYVEKPTWRLLPEDHTKSLLFIERLKGNKINRTTMNMVERELSKVKHLEEMYGV